MTALNLFAALRPASGAEARAPRLFPSDGLERYLTQAVALVLHHDPALVRRLMQQWLGLSVPADATVRVEAGVTFALPEDGEVGVDLVLRADGHLVFVATSAAGEGSDRDAGEARRRYARALDAQREVAPERRHLVALRRSPAPRRDDVPYDRGAFVWWDLYALLHRHGEATLRPRGDRRQWLQSELLDFFAQLQLDPPRSLRREPFRPAEALRVLAEAARRVEGIGRPRLSDHRLLFDLDGQTDLHLGFDSTGALRAGRAPGGALGVRPLDAAFWSADVESQIATLVARLRELPRAERVSSAAASLDELLAVFDV